MLPIILFYLITLIISTFAGEAPDYEVLFLSFCDVHIPFKIQTLDSVPHSQIPSLTVTGQVLHPYKTRNTILFHILIFILLDMTHGDKEC
jgi:hypothetical protein